MGFFKGWQGCSEQPSQPSENPVHPSSLTWINPLGHDKTLSPLLRYLGHPAILFVQLVTERFPTVRPCSLLRNRGVCPFPLNLQNIIIPKPLELWSWHFDKMFIAHHVSCDTFHLWHVNVHMSPITCHLSPVPCQKQNYVIFLIPKKIFPKNPIEQESKLSTDATYNIISLLKQILCTPSYIIFTQNAISIILKIPFCRHFQIWIFFRKRTKYYSQYEF